AALGTALWAPILGAARSFSQSGSELLLMSQRTGISVEALSALKFAARETAVPFEDLETGLRHMSRTVQDAADGNPAAVQSLQDLGLSIADLRDLSKEGIFAKLADGISKIQNPLTQSARAQEIFGRHAESLLPLLQRGAEGLAKYKEQAERFGHIKTEAQV